jgi:hypothetical protein
MVRIAELSGEASKSSWGRLLDWKGESFVFDLIGDI